MPCQTTSQTACEAIFKGALDSNAHNSTLPVDGTSCKSSNSTWSLFSSRGKRRAACMRSFLFRQVSANDFVIVAGEDFSIGERGV